MTDPDIDDLLGPDPAEVSAPSVYGLREVHGGVSLSWLAQVFKMDRQTIKRRLAHCPPIRLARGNTPLFDLTQAAAYLVTPKVDIAAWIRSLRPQDLPPGLQKEFWDARLKRQRWEREAGDLWHTRDVLDVLGEAFKRIKETAQLWTDDVERAHGLTAEQRITLTRLVDGLQDDLHERLVEMAGARRTSSLAAEVDEGAEPGDAV